jgi:hypothetical protein
MSKRSGQLPFETIRDKRLAQTDPAPRIGELLGSRWHITSRHNDGVEAPTDDAERHDCGLPPVSWRAPYS